MVIGGYHMARPFTVAIAWLDLGPLMTSIHVSISLYGSCIEYSTTLACVFFADNVRSIKEVVIFLDVSLKQTNQYNLYYLSI